MEKRSDDAWYKDNVAALYEAGIIKDVDATTFAGNSTLTRQQAAVMIHCLLINQGIETPVISKPIFSDVNKMSKEGKVAASIMRELGIFEGKEGNVFDAQAPFTRRQMAKVLVNVMKLIQFEEGI